MHSPKLPLRLLVGVSCVVLCGAVRAASGAGSLEGTWRLAAQSYGNGRANQARAEEPLRLQFTRDGLSLRGTIWAGAARERAIDWPSLLDDGRARPVRLLDSRMDPDGDRVSARYRVEPEPGDDLVLEVTEEYRLSDDATALVGTVHVAFVRDGEPRGSYVLHRRFEREP